MDDSEKADEAKLSRSARRAMAAQDALRALIRDAVEHELAPHRLPDGNLDLRLHLQVTPRDEWRLKFLPSLRRQILDQVGDLIVEREVYLAGRVYCFRCESSLCEHAAPPSAQQVFRGYGSTGEPEWHELAQSFIQAGDERVDRLYQRTPQVVALVVTGRELKAEQLSSFGRSSKSYALLGQVVAGYFEREKVAGVEDVRFALSFQFVETRTASGQVALRVNPVGRVPGGGDLSELYAEGWGEWIHRAQRKAVDELEDMARRINDAGEERSKTARATLVRLPKVMRRFAASLDRGHRQTRRRTKHAEQRRQERRPVQKAIEDASAISDSDLLYEERTDAVVVPGAQGRIHVFSREGKHMTSFTGKSGTVESRVRSQRWRPLELEMAAAFRERLVTEGDDG